MSKVKFPKRRPDGSFCVEVVVPVATTDPEKLLPRVSEWATRWVNSNRLWVRQWKSGENLREVQPEELHYDAEFESGPRATYDSGFLKLRFEGRSSAKWWKDWLVLRFLPDLKQSFPEISSADVAFRNCDEGP